MKRIIPLAALAVVSLMAAPGSQGETATPAASKPGAASQPNPEITALKQEIQSLKEQLKQLQSDMQAIRTFLVAQQRRAEAAQAPAPNNQPPPAPVAINVAGYQAKGSKDAKLALIEFTDYQ